MMTKQTTTEVPDWAKWKAQDANGLWHVFEDKPDFDIGYYEWYTFGSPMLRIGEGDPNPNWRDTLVEL